MKKKGNKCGIDAHGLAMSKETQKRREGKGNKAERTITEESSFWPYLVGIAYRAVYFTSREYIRIRVHPMVHLSIAIFFFPRWWFSICGPNQNLRAVPHHCSYSPTRKWGGPSSGFFTVVCQRIHNIVRWSVSPFLERALPKIPS